MNKAIISLVIVMSIWASCQQEKYSQGKRIYTAYCANCHMENGEGLGEIYPSITKSSYLYGNITELPCLILNGRQSSQLSTVQMPGFSHLREAELSNLINYMSHTWGDKSILPIDEIQNKIINCQ